MQTNPRFGFSSDVNLSELCKHWSRAYRDHKLPYEATQNFTANQTKQIFDHLAKMYMLQKVVPVSLESFSAVVVQGSVLFRAVDRLEFVLELCRTHRIERIYVVGSDRKLDAVLE